jgi:hypothetical protein
MTSHCIIWQRVSRLSAVEVEGCQLHSHCLGAQHDVGPGDLARYNLDMYREMAATCCVARNWEENDSMLSYD